MAVSSLKDKTVNGVGWSAVDNVTQYAVSFIVSIVLARLLSPDDYGLIGVIAIFTAICNTIINAGFTTALIQKKDTTNDDYNTVFLVNLGLSVFLYLIIYFLSPDIALFFKREELIALTRVSSLSLIVGALALVQQTILTKRIDFKSQTKITLVSSLLSGLVGIILAITGFGVWALVAQQLSAQTVRTIMLWFINKWIPKLSFSRNSFRSLFGFGWKLMVSSLLDTIWQELYQVIIGRFYSPAILGQFTRAKSFSQLLSSNLTTVIQRVTFPILSSIQDQKERMVVSYRKIIKTTMFVSAIGMFCLGAVSEPLLYCLIGPKWHEAAIYLPLLCITGSLYPLHAINLNMIEVQGRGWLYLIIEILKKIIAVFPLATGIFFGVLPMLYASVLTNVLCFFINSHYSGKYIGYSSWMQIKDVAPSYFVATLIAVPVFLLKYLPLSNWIILPMQITVGICLFIVICKIIKMEEYNEIKGILTKYIRRFSKK